MKKLIQKAVKVLAFLLVLALCYGLMDQVLKIKTDDMVSMVKLRQLPPDTVDVLLVGSSHIGTMLIISRFSMNMVFQVTICGLACNRSGILTIA